MLQRNSNFKLEKLIKEGDCFGENYLRECKFRTNNVICVEDSVVI